MEFKLPPTLAGKKSKEVRILPRCKALWFEIEYVCEAEPEKVDLGLDNFATCVSTSGAAFIIEERGLKSFNRWWNKEKAKLQSIYDKQGIKMGKKMAWLLRKR
ncbi:transposase, partial [Thermococcus sp.]